MHTYKYLHTHIYKDLDTDIIVVFYEMVALESFRVI